MRKIRLLLIEDEQTLAGIIKDTLNDNGFDVDMAFNGEEGLRKFNAFNPDIVVTDIMMPKMDGFSVAEHIRVLRKNIPILFLTARTKVDDVIHGFEIGGNDYIRKPFAMGELIVRAKALVGKASSKEHSDPEYFTIGKYKFVPAKNLLEFYSSSEKNIQPQTSILSQRESNILSYLCRNINETVPTKDLLLDIWGDDSYFNSRSLNVFISHLRNYLGHDTSVTITNIRGVGYKLSGPSATRYQ